jgi:hypothetical protein
MNIQYISDSTGQTTGVFIPIQEWNELLAILNDEKTIQGNIPEWHKNVVRERLVEYKTNPGSGMNFNATMDEIDNSL